MPLTDDDVDLVEVVIACTNGQIGRAAAREIMDDLDRAGFEIVRKQQRKRNHFETDGCSPPDWLGPTGE